VIKNQLKKIRLQNLPRRNKKRPAFYGGAKIKGESNYKLRFDCTRLTRHTRKPLTPSSITNLMIVA
jgi:hypothetical protein